jgi:hypothetical protein
VQEDAFRHELFEYSEGAGGFVRGVLPHLSCALAAEEPVLVAVASEKIVAPTEALGEDAERVLFTDMRSLGTCYVHMTWTAWTIR